MAWWRTALAHLALAQSREALVNASGGAPRTVRGMTLDPRLQFIEARARQRAAPWDEMSVAVLRRQIEHLSDMFGGARVSGVRQQTIYITGRSHSVPARLYLPTVRDNKAAMLVYFHFGGGVAGSPENCARLCAMIAKLSGAPVLAVQYRLGPEHRFPAGLEDAFAAYAWATENAGRYGAGVRKVAVGGEAAGGGFAAILCQHLRGQRTPQPVLQLLIYPLLDLVSETASLREFADAFPLTAELQDFFLRHYLPADADPAEPRLSPGRTQDLRRLPPALLYTAGFDILLDQAEGYGDRLQEAGGKVARVRFESLPHGFVAFPSAAPAAEAALMRIARETADALKRA